LYQGFVDEWLIPRIYRACFALWLAYSSLTVVSWTLQVLMHEAGELLLKPRERVAIIRAAEWSECGDSI
jgi:hypothetical protein